MELVLKNLTKVFEKDGGQVRAVDGVDLRVGKGEFITFLGPSGCGKTTTLRMIAGFEDPSDGAIFLGDQDITHLAANKRDLGFVFQNYALFPHMTVAANVAYGLNVRGVSKAEVEQRVTEALAAVGLEKEGRRYPNQLSGGQQQRVALARALVLRPKLLLMDEPLSNLDAKLRNHMRGEIRRIQKEWGLTCLYVTHDQKEALTMSDRIMVMNAGRVEQIGTPQELYATPKTAFVADFIGNANLLEGKLSLSSEPTFTRGNWSVPCRLSDESLRDGDDVMLVLRPERFKVDGEGLAVTVTQALFEGDRISYLGRDSLGGELEFSLPADQNYAPGENVRLTSEGVAVVIRP